jgi:hypothetical protein
MGYFSNLDIENKEEQGREEAWNGRAYRQTTGYRNYGPMEARPYKVVETPFGIQDFPTEEEARRWAAMRHEKGLSKSYKVFRGRKQI